MNVAQLIATLSDQNPDSEVTVTVGGNTVENFNVEVDSEGHVVLRGAEETTTTVE